VIRNGAGADTAIVADGPRRSDHLGGLIGFDANLTRSFLQARGDRRCSACGGP
jgi:hypothetical protein